MSLREVIGRVLAEHGIVPDFMSPHAAHALEKLEMIASKAAGPWQYRAAGGNDRKHPLQKVLSELDRLESAMREAKLAADSHQKPDEVNAAAEFFQYVETFTEDEAFRLIRAMRQAAEGALELGQERPRNAPLRLRNDAFIVEMFFLLRAHRAHAEFDESFLFIANGCQEILPIEDRETLDQMRVRIAAIQRRRPSLFEKWK